MSRFAVAKRPRLASNKMVDFSADLRQLFNAMLCCASWQCRVKLWGGQGTLAHGSRVMLQVKTEVPSDSLSSCSSIQGMTALVIASVRVNRTMIALATIFVLLSQVFDAKSSTIEVAEARRECTLEISAWLWRSTVRLLGAGAMLSVSARVPAAVVKTVRCGWAGGRLGGEREGGCQQRGGLHGGGSQGGWMVWGVVCYHYITKEECG